MIRAREVEPGLDDDDGWLEVQTSWSVFDDEDAAAEACEHWSSHGRWAGDPMPEEIEVEVDFNGVRSVVVVHVDWEPVFTGIRKVEAETGRQGERET